MNDLSGMSDADREHFIKGNYDAMSNEGLDIAERYASGKGPEDRKIGDGMNYLLSKAGIDPEGFAGGVIRHVAPLPLAQANLAGSVFKQVASNPTHPFQAAGAVLNADTSQIGSALDAVSAVGRFANSGNQQLAGAMRQGGPVGNVAGNIYGGMSNVLMPQDRMAAAALPLTAGGSEGAVNATQKAVGPATTKTGAQVLKGFTGIMEDAGKQFLENPVRVLTAPSTAQAGENIANSAAKHGLKAGMDGYAEVFGSEFAPTPADLVGMIKDKWPTAAKLSEQLESSAIKPQEALSMIQAINHAKMLPKYQNPLNAQEMSILLDRRGQLTDFLEQKGLGEIPDALENYRYSKIKDQMMSLLPVNKYGDASVLRLLTGAGLAGGSEAYARHKGGSNPIGAALALGAFSPAIAGPAMGGASLLGQGLSAVGGLPAKVGLMNLGQNMIGANQ